jgi:hypothetical protein
MFLSALPVDDTDLFVIGYIQGRCQEDIPKSIAVL